MAVLAAGNARLALEEPRDGRSEAGRGHSVGDSLWNSGNDNQDSRPGCLHPGLNQLQGAGIRDLAGLGEAGKRGWDLSWVSLSADVALSHHILPGKVLGPHTLIQAARAGLWDGPQRVLLDSLWEPGHP